MLRHLNCDLWAKMEEIGVIPTSFSVFTKSPAMSPRGYFERELQPRQAKHHPFAKGQIINMSGSLADP